VAACIRWRLSVWTSRNRSLSPSLLFFYSHSLHFIITQCLTPSSPLASSHLLSLSVSHLPVPLHFSISHSCLPLPLYPKGRRGVGGRAAATRSPANEGTVDSHSIGLGHCAAITSIDVNPLLSHPNLPFPSFPLHSPIYSFPPFTLPSFYTSFLKIRFIPPNKKNLSKLTLTHNVMKLLLADKGEVLRGGLGM